MIENLIVPVLNRYDLLQRMLDSVDATIGHLLVIDNGASLSKAGLDLTYSDKFEQVTYLPLPANQGVGGSWNLGIKSFPFHSRWFIGSNDIVFEPGALEKLATASEEEITLTESFPNWQMFVLGEEAVEKIGLFDECGFYPAYFEDDDYRRRASKAGVNIRKLDISIRHDNSSTIQAGYQQKNSKTFTANQSLLNKKINEEDYSPGYWDLAIRRENSWD
jgi:GT2 family glycosyltransferase